MDRARWLRLLLATIALAAVAILALFATHRSSQQRLARLELEFEVLRGENAALRARWEEWAPLRQRVDSLSALGAAGLPAQAALHAFPPPTELTFCGERLPLEDPDVHQRLEEEWNRYLVNRHWLVSWMRRSREAYPHVEARLRAAGLPTDLKYVMTIESAIDPRATSTAGAVGYWQFIGGTGQRYGLRRDNNVDERRDLAKATDAAIAYLKDLHEEFGSWALALSAYNCGEARVRSEIAIQGTNDYYALTLPRETEAYWFKAAALKPLFESPDAYGFLLTDDGWQSVACDTLELRLGARRVDLRELATASKISYRELKRLNPWFRRSYVDGGPYKLVVPQSGAAGVLAAVEGASLRSRSAEEFAASQAVESSPAASVAGPLSAPPQPIERQR